MYLGLISLHWQDWMIKVVFLSISSHSQALQRSSLPFVTNSTLDNVVPCCVTSCLVLLILLLLNCRFLLLGPSNITLLLQDCTNMEDLWGSNLQIRVNHCTSHFADRLDTNFRHSSTLITFWSWKSSFPLSWSGCIYLALTLVWVIRNNN